MTHEILVRELREYAENGKSLIDGHRLCRSAASAVEILDRLCDWYEAENKKLTDALGDSFAIDLMNRLEKVKAERDAAIEMLHGYCPACKNYTENHCEGSCADCKHEYWIYKSADARDNWEWRGVKDENNSR